MSSRVWVGRAHRVIQRFRSRSTRRERLFLHVGRNQPIQARIVPDIAPTEEDVANCERLLAAYQKATAARPAVAGDDIWTHIRSLQADYFEILDATDARRLAAYLCNMGRQTATHGTIQGAAEYRRLRRSSTYRRFIAQLIKERLVCLAEATGAIPIENPEQGEWGRNFSIPADALAERITEILGVDITPPPIDGGLFKIVAGDRLLGERDCSSIYTAWLLSRDARGQSIAEIGGGGARLAYWSRRFGAKSYSIYDLPHINILQGFYLLKAGLQVSLYGEEESAIRIRPDFDFPSARHDVVLNQDSFPEIHPDIVRDYLRNIRKCADRFISINHESEPVSLGTFTQRSVPSLIKEVGGFVRQSRDLFWLRPGYCYEVYSTK